MSCLNCGHPTLSGVSLCVGCASGRRTVEIRHPDGRRETRSEPIDPSRLFIEMVDSIPAENRGRLNMLGEGDALTYPWVNRDVPLTAALLDINRAFTVKTGFGLSQICCSSNVFRGMVLRSQEFLTFATLHLTTHRALRQRSVFKFVVALWPWLEWLVDFDPILEAHRAMPGWVPLRMHRDGVLFSASCYDLALVGRGPWRGNHPPLPQALAAADVGADRDGLISPTVRWLAPLPVKPEPEPAVPAGWRL